MGVSKKNGTPKSSIFLGFSIIHHPFWGTPIFGNIHIEPNMIPYDFAICWTLWESDVVKDLPKTESSEGTFFPLP